VSARSVVKLMALQKASMTHRHTVRRGTNEAETVGRVIRPLCASMAGGAREYPGKPSALLA